MANHILERFIEDTNAAKSSADAARLYGNALNDFGYDRFCYSLLTDHPSLGLSCGHGIVRNYPDDWMAHYRANRYEQKDPVPRHAFTNHRPYTWDSVVQAGALKPEQRRVMNEASEAGLLDGIAIPVCGQRGELAGVAMASSVGGIRPDKNLLGKVRALTHQFHEVYTSFEQVTRPLQYNLAEHVRLTPREKEVLSWVAEGKTDDFIARILCITHAAVRFHMTNVFKKLDANDRALAIAKAIRHGLILPSYVG